MKAIVIYSGGLDSTVLLTKVKSDVEDVVALNFDYGSKHNIRERTSAIRVCNQLEIPIVLMDLDFIGQSFKSDLLKSGGAIPKGHYEEESMKSTVVPFRNGIMLSIAAGYAESIGARQLLLASHAGDHTVYADCRPEFNYMMATAIHLGTESHIQVVAPFQHITKTQIVAIGGIFNAPLHLTYSCYNGRENHCGFCGTCVERIESFKLAGLVDPVNYEIQIDWPNCEPIGNSK